jgi:hypothetical protein
MRKDWKYIAYLSAAVVFYLALKLLAPREIDWTITFHHQDKNPFGAYALNTVLPVLFSKSTVHQSYATVYELYDTVKQPANFISISSVFKPGQEDTDALLKNIADGGSAFISAQYFSGPFADTFSIATADYFFEETDLLFNRNDTSSLSFVNPSLQPSTPYFFPRNNIHNYFSKPDSTAMVVAQNDLTLPVTIKINHGKGSLYLNCTPLAFTNIYLLANENYDFAAMSLSHLPNRIVYWTEFYHLGKREARTPLRFILSTEPLRWAYYVSIASLLAFILFEAKRKQRIIPIVTPLSNTSLEFVRTISALYFHSGDHKNIAEKRIQFLFDQLRTKYSIAVHSINDELIQHVVRKSGNQEEIVRKLFSAIATVQRKDQLTEMKLKDLNSKIDSFNI